MVIFETAIDISIIILQLKCRLKFSSKMSIFSSGSYVYVQLFHFNSNEKNLFIALM